jgi:hypothetical protein
LRGWIGLRRSIFGANELVSNPLRYGRERRGGTDCDLVVPIPEGVEKSEEEPEEDFDIGAARDSECGVSDAQIGAGKD